MKRIELTTRGLSSLESIVAKLAVTVNELGEEIPLKFQEDFIMDLIDYSSKRKEHYQNLAKRTGRFPLMNELREIIKKLPYEEAIDSRDIAQRFNLSSSPHSISSSIDRIIQVDGNECELFQIPYYRDDYSGPQFYSGSCEDYVRLKVKNKGRSNNLILPKGDILYPIGQLSLSNDGTKVVYSNSTYDIKRRLSSKEKDLLVKELFSDKSKIQNILEVYPIISVNSIANILREVNKRYLQGVEGKFTHLTEKSGSYYNNSIVPGSINIIAQAGLEFGFGLNKITKNGKTIALYDPFLLGKVKLEEK